MKAIKKLRNKFLFFSLTSIVISVLIFLAIYLRLIDEIFFSFLTSIDGALIALAIGLFIYWQERKDYYKSMHSGLLSSLEYLINDLPQSEKFTHVVAGYLNTTFINEIIRTGLFNEVLTELIKLQSHIEYYDLFIKESVKITHKTNRKGIEGYEKTNIDKSYSLLVEKAKIIKVEIRDKI